MAGDKADRNGAVRTWLTRHEIAAVIPSWDNASGPKTYARAAYRERSLSARTINRLTRSRRSATRSEQLATADLALVTIACVPE